MTDHDEARLLAESFVNGSNHAWGDADQLHYIDRDGNVCALTGAGARIIARALLDALDKAEQQVARLGRAMQS